MSALAIPHLRAFWARTIAQRNATTAQDDSAWMADTAMLRGLRVELHETLAFLYSAAPSFDQFEAWILEKNGGTIGQERIDAINIAVDGGYVSLVDTSDDEPLSSDDLAFFEEHGYVVLRDAVSPESAREAADAICSFLGMDLTRPETWYAHADNAPWVPLVHHPVLDTNRNAPRIAHAYAQLWKRDDLWPSVDRCGMNPPEHEFYRYPGQGLHWDVSLVPPIPFGLQGELYLTDTPAEQGAFTCVPGFHLKIDEWLSSLPAHVDPRRIDITQFGPVPVAGKAGDLVIWHQALPHAGSPNRGVLPRLVQYVTYTPSTWERADRWL